jgi:hypothetical protein
MSFNLCAPGRFFIEIPFFEFNEAADQLRNRRATPSKNRQFNESILLLQAWQSISIRKFTDINILRPIEKDAHIRRANQSSLTLAVRIAISFALFAWTTQRAVIVVTNRHRTVVRGRYTDIDFPIPAVIRANIVDAVKPGGTVSVFVTITLALATGATDQTIVDGSN